MRTSGNAAGEVAEQAARSAPHDAISGLRAAMPGSVSAEAAVALAVQWNAELSAWVNDMRRYGDELRRSAELYESTDSAAERAFGGVPEQRGPV